MTGRVVVVLEDSPDRVDWLRSAVAPFEVECHERVTPFVDAVRRHEVGGSLALVVFDHDLGHAPPPSMCGTEQMWNYDEDGNTGEDAAANVCAFSAPALVWSWNSHGAKRIAVRLEDKADGVVVAPFKRGVEFAALVGRLLGGTDGR